jgi:fumarate reductase subunit C
MRHDRVYKSIAAYLRRHKSQTPARLDLMQSVTGLVLALFIAGHLLFEASILISKDAMYVVTKFFEGYYFFGETYPGIISFLAAGIFVVFIIHAFTAIRKFPSSYRQYRIFKNHMGNFKHNDTSLWFYQIVTGFAMFFLGSVHLYMMMAMPDKIGPYASADRIYSDWMWPLYLLLLISVILHAAIGLYRLALKWGVFEGKNAKESRKAMKKVMIITVVVYMTISLLSLGTYMMIGYEHADRAGERYVPASEVTQ